MKKLYIEYSLILFVLIGCTQLYQVIPSEPKYSCYFHEELDSWVSQFNTLKDFCVSVPIPFREGYANTYADYLLQNEDTGKRVYLIIELKKDSHYAWMRISMFTKQSHPYLVLSSDDIQKILAGNDTEYADWICTQLAG